MNTSDGKFSLDSLKVDVKKILIGAVYLLLIGVVIYGMHDHVYDGFGGVVPWLIMAIFAVMSVIRVLEGATRKEFRQLASAALRRINDLRNKAE